MFLPKMLVLGGLMPILGTYVKIILMNKESGAPLSRLQFFLVRIPI
jgi:hypothetical protein